MLLLRTFVVVLWIGAVMSAELSWGRRLASGVTASKKGKVTTVTFSDACKSPVTVTSDEPFRRTAGGVSRFSLRLPTKGARTAIGLQFSSSPSTQYLTPSYQPSLTTYISFGGAGYLYPAKKPAKNGYSEGDAIEVSLDWSANVVRFYVNSVLVGTGTIEDSSAVEVAWPSISSEGGVVVAEIGAA